jgi:hypothetical protein
VPGKNIAVLAVDARGLIAERRGRARRVYASAAPAGGVRAAAAIARAGEPKQTFRRCWRSISRRSRPGSA